jgi:hypothetical protein
VTGSLKVNTDELRNVGSAFTGAGDKLAAVQADAPLGDAAAAVPQLQTAGACNAAKASVATEMSNIATGARTFGGNLSSAAGQYESTDRASGGTIAGVDMPSPADH